ncbi:hypothetical protein HG536_0B03980 [Torulaspora globosa]|uniref:Uncharacterized protein n=1 Tax=Torulaspora globosa TaxID=48254 RepID=A0A7G3ZDE8_9SACH|nr:uncharacterized protein HG536_0B03980 [Torulaspora globosa]QLL31534.1 hypothetical protein HG536_0B03980 [Torulaspora globosa]
MNNGSSITTGGLSPMCSLEARIKSFRNTAIIDGKKYRWPYTVIPFEDMAKLGFFYHPFKDSKLEGEVCRDAVQCVYCKNVTHDFKECRSKKKDITETMTNVLRQHLANDGESCLLSSVKLQALQDVSMEFESVKWEETPVFRDPLGQKATHLRKFTFEMNWNLKSDNLTPQKMSEAGLLRYDSSFTGFEDLTEGQVHDACYCIYCKRLVASWQSHDNPLLEHYKSCGGNCFFFKTMKADINYSGILQELEDKLANDSFANDTDKEPCRATNGLIEKGDAPLGKIGEENDEREVESLLASGSSSPASEGNGQLSSPMKSPIRKKRLLRRSSTKRYFEGDTSNVSEIGADQDKDLVVEFKDHVEKARTVGRKNKILDDSSDDFSFSAQGQSTFEIPAIPVPLAANNFEKVDEETEEHSDVSQSERAASHEQSKESVHSDLQNERLNAIPIDGILSPDTSLRSSIASTPIHSPQTGPHKILRRVDQLPEEPQHLRHLRGRKIL